MKITVKKLTINDRDMCAKTIADSPILDKILNAKGFNLAVTVDGSVRLIVLVSYGKKYHHAIFSQLWTDDTIFAKKAFVRILKLFDKIHYGWKVYFATEDVNWFKSRSVKHNDYLYQYTGCL